MNYRVVLPREVLAAIDAHVLYLVNEGAPTDRVDSWLDNLVAIIDSLHVMPRRFPVAEAVSAAKGYEVRRVNHAGCAIFYRVVDAEGTVELLAFRHGRRQPWPEEPAS